MSIDSRYAAPATIGRYLLPAPELSSKPAARDRQIDGRTLDSFRTLIAYYADRVISSQCEVSLPMMLRY